MKKLWLLLLIPFIAINVKAQEIDKNFEYFNNYSFYYSGNVYKKTITYMPWAYFHTNEGTLAFINNYYYDDLFINFEPVERDYVVDLVSVNRDNLFDIERDYEGPIKIPQYKGKKIFWIYNNSSYDDMEEDYFDEDSFYPYSNVPEFVFECDKEELKYGETSQCTLTVINESYTRAYEGFIETFKLSSNDYDISNIELSDYFIYDSDEDRYVPNLESLSNPDGFGDDLNLSLVTTDNNDEVISKNRLTSIQAYVESLNIDEESNEPDYLLDENTYYEWRFKAVTFTVTPKREETVKGVVYVNNINVFDLDSINVIAIEDVEAEIFTEKEEVEEEVEEEVKAEEEEPQTVIEDNNDKKEEKVENPKTGGNNTLIISLSILVLMIGSYFFISKKDLFKSNL